MWYTSVSGLEAEKDMQAVIAVHELTERNIRIFEVVPDI